MKIFSGKKQSGVGLIEVLVTVLLFLTGLLVLSALQVRSLQYNHSAYMRSQANIFAYDIIDRIRLNRQNFASYSLNYSSSIPTGSTLAATDMHDWVTNLRTVLPNGKGKIQCNVSGICTIGIQWSEVQTAGETSENTSTFTFSTRI